MAKYGLVMVEQGAFIHTSDGTRHYNTDHKGGEVDFAVLKASTREEALKEVRDVIDYHGGVIHTHSNSFKGEKEEYTVHYKWSHLFLVENVTALPYQEWAKEAEDEFWRGLAEDKECAERAEYERLREKYGDNQEA